jgi:high-affinity iron transporter
VIPVLPPGRMTDAEVKATRSASNGCERCLGWVPSPAVRQVKRARREAASLGVFISAGLIAATLTWQGVTSADNPDQKASQTIRAAAVLEIGILVFREGLECILVLAAITASMTGSEEEYQRPVTVGAEIAFVATLITWRIARRALDDIDENISALDIQAATGLLAVLVLLLVMNWFFHRVYWTGWISVHNKRKRELLRNERQQSGKLRIMRGMGLLGFTSFYREGFEVVLFLQSYRLKLGGAVVLYGALSASSCPGLAIITFAAHRRLPYRKMLVLTGAMLAFVLLVMVGEQVQEMQLARWSPTTEIPWLKGLIPSWMGLWFSIFPTRETLGAQAVAGLLVFGSYVTSWALQGGARFNRKN